MNINQNKLINDTLIQEVIDQIRNTNNGIINITIKDSKITQINKLGIMEPPWAEPMVPAPTSANISPSASPKHPDRFPLRVNQKTSGLSSHSTTGITRGLMRRRIKDQDITNIWKEGGGI